MCSSRDHWYNALAMHCVAETRNSYVDQISIDSNHHEVKGQRGSSGDVSEHYQIVPFTEKGLENKSLIDQYQSPAKQQCLQVTLDNSRIPLMFRPTVYTNYVSRNYEMTNPPTDLSISL